MASTSVKPVLPLEKRKKCIFDPRTGREEELSALVSPAKTEERPHVRPLGRPQLSLPLPSPHPTTLHLYFTLTSSPTILMLNSLSPLFPLPPHSLLTLTPIPSLLTLTFTLAPWQDPSWCQSVHFLPYGCANRDDPQWAEAIELMDRDLRWLLTLDHAQFWNQVERETAAVARSPPTHLADPLIHMSQQYLY